MEKFKCEICGKEYQDEKWYNLHMEKHKQENQEVSSEPIHSEPISEPLKPVFKRLNTRLSRCKNCQKIVITKKISSHHCEK